jgi:GT2 family glycosyltransferase
MSLLRNLFFLDTLLPSNPLLRFQQYQDDPLLDELIKSRKDCLYEIEQAAGACLFIPAQVYADLGGLNESYYPAWFEDVEFAKKIHSSGLASALHTGTEVVHQGGTSEKSIGRKGLLKYFYKNMSRYWSMNCNNRFYRKTGKAVIFICFAERRLAHWIKELCTVSGKDSLKQVLGDFYFYFSGEG